MKHSFFLALFLYSLASANVDNIITSKEVSFIDSLLINQNLGQLIEFFNKKGREIEKQKLNQVQISKYLLLKNEYVELINFSKKLKSIDSVTLNNLIQQYINFEYRFKLPKAGRQSYELYQKFKLYNSSGDKVKALIFYKSAYFFKKKFMRQIINTTRNNLKNAYTLFKNNNLHDAQIIIDRIDKNVNKSLLTSSVIDSLNMLYSKKESRQDRIEKKKHFLEEKIVVNNSLNISFGINFIHQNEIRDIIMEFRNKSDNSPEMINIRYVPSKLVLNYTATFDYRILNSLFIGMDFNYSEFIYSGKNINDLVFFDFSLKNYLGHIFVKYQARNNIGLRPYFNFGFGYLYSVRERTDGIILYFDDDPDTKPIITFYDIPKKKYGFPQLLYETGIDYLPNSELNFLFGIKSSLYQHINFNDFIGQFNFAFGVYTSYWY